VCADFPLTLADFEQRGVTYTTSLTSSSSWYSSHDVRRPLSWQVPGDMDETAMYPAVQGVHPAAIDYRTATPDAAARRWSLVDVKPCMTTCALSTYTGKLNIEVN